MYEIKKQGAVSILQGDDPLNFEQTNHLTKLLNECCSQGQPRVIVNLQFTPLIDSAGLEFLLDANERLQRQGGKLQVSCANQLCREVLRITQLDRRINCTDDIVTALGSFAQ
jgi:anti-anti-sigma factor